MLGAPSGKFIHAPVHSFLSPQWPFGHMMQRADSLAKTLMPGKIEGRRRRGRLRMRRLEGITNSMAIKLSKLWEIVSTGKPGMLKSMGLQRVRHNLAAEKKQTDI